MGKFERECAACGRAMKIGWWKKGWTARVGKRRDVRWRMARMRRQREREKKKDGVDGDARG